MDLREWIAQIIGLVAMGFNVLSYQGKKQSTVIALQMMGGALFTVNYFMLGATVGSVLNGIAVIRALVYLFKDKLKADRLPWLIAFMASYIGVYILNFALWGAAPTPKNLMLELLPVIGMLALNIGFRLKNAADVRKFGLVSSPAWLVYNIAVGSWGAIFCEVLTLISIFVGMLRLDKKKPK